MTTIAQWYERVNATWPNNVPELTGPEAIAAARKLYRYGFGYSFAGTVKLTSGRRYTWIRRGVMSVNPAGITHGRYGGWRALVHDLSHYVHLKTNPGARPHCAEHARLEIRMIKECVKRGFLDGVLKPRPIPTSAVDAVAVNFDALRKLERVEARIKAWTTKHKRATTALYKLNRERAKLARKL